MLRTSSDGLGVAYDWKEKEMKADWGPVKGSKPLPAAFVCLLCNAADASANTKEEKQD